MGFYVYIKISLLIEGFRKGQRLYNYHLREERNVFPFYIPAIIYIFLLLLRKYKTVVMNFHN